MLRIIGGELAGRQIWSVPGEATRPPLARVRGAVANILMEYIPGSKVLDLFAGTGSYSIELLSRGSSFAVMVDNSPKAISVMKRNIDELGLTRRVELIQGDALKVIPLLKSRGETFQIILVAPPYFSGLDQTTMESLGTGTLLDPAGIVVLQQHKKELLQDEYGFLILKKTYSYGDTRISTFRVRR
ncbi:MAG TPA: 16S rRNA (guanine(966)-N(2))-methyltransferase RsmD [Firmicutes bacterium]|nr:16S rRNA (guanine(966)-N(2))-methyltransferase RsmD [Candidatus Fermentithermobacillaceae bacterium]